MTCANQNFTMSRGETRRMLTTVTDTGLATGTPVDISAATITWGLFPSDKSTYADAIVIKTIGSDVFLIDAPNGEFEVVINPADTQGAGTDSQNRFYHEAEIIIGTDEAIVLSGWIDLCQSPLGENP